MDSSTLHYTCTPNGETRSQFDDKVTAAISASACVGMHEMLAKQYLPRLFGNDEYLVELDLNTTYCGDVSIIGLADAITNNTKLQRLFLDSNMITDEGVIILVKALEVNRSIREITLNNNCIGSRGAAALCKTLEINDRLTVLSVSGNNDIERNLFQNIALITKLNKYPLEFKRYLLALRNGTICPNIILSRSEASKWSGDGTDSHLYIDDWCVEQLATELADNKTVTLLDISNNMISDEGAKYLANMIRNNKYLDMLILTGNAISSLGADMLRDAIYENNTLHHLLMYNNLCNNEKLMEVEWVMSLNRQPLLLKYFVDKMRKSDPTVTHVVLDHCIAERYYNDVTCRILVDILSVNKIVTSLSVTNSKITEVGARFLADLFAQNNIIKFVDLHSNPIEKGGIYIARSLLVNKSIIKLDMSNTGLDDECGFQFAQSLQTNMTLVELDLSDNPLIGPCGKAFSSLSLNNRVLKRLHLTDTSMDDAIVTDIMDHQEILRESGILQGILPAIIDNDNSLTELHLCGKDVQNRINDSSVKLLVDALKHNSFIRYLDLSHNDITYVGLTSICDLLENYSDINELDLSYNSIGSRSSFVLLAEVLPFSSLRKLKINGIGLDPEAAEAICENMKAKRHYPLQELEFEDNMELDAFTTFKLNMFVKFNTLLIPFKRQMMKFWTEFCDLNAVGSYDVMVADLSRYAGHNIHANPLQESGEVIPCSMEDTNNTPSTTTIGLNQTSYNEAFKIFCDALKYIKVHTTVKFAYNGIDDEGLSFISDMIGDDTLMFTEIDISGSRITDVGLKTLIMKMRSNYRVVSVRIYDCPYISKEVINELKWVLLYAKHQGDIKELRLKFKHNDGNASDIDFSDVVTNHLTDHQIKLLCVDLTISDNVLVNSINVSNNYISMVGLKDLVELMKIRQNITVLKASNTNIRGGNSVGVVVADLLNNSNTIQELDFSYCELKDDFAEPVLEAIRSNRSIQWIHLKETGLSLENVSDINKYISLNRVAKPTGILSQLAANECSVTAIISPNGTYNDINIVALFTALKSNITVKEVDLSGNYISDSAGCKVMKLLKHNKAIERITMKDNRLGKMTLQKLADTLAHNATLKYVDFSSNSISQQTADDVQDGILPVNDTILRIDLSHQTSPLKDCSVEYFMHGLELNLHLEIKNSIGKINRNDSSFTEFVVTGTEHDNICCSHLSRPLMSNTYLVRIDLSNGKIRDEGVNHLKNGLFINRSVKDLNLSYNLIGDNGCKMLADVIKVNDVLQVMSIEGNTSVTDEGIAELQRVLVFRDNVVKLNLSNCERVSEKISKKVDFFTELNSRHLELKDLFRNEEKVITAVDCSYARKKGKVFDDRACEILCKAILDDTFITSLNLSGNDLSINSALSIASLLAKNTTITHIDLHDNNICDGITYISSAVIKNSTLLSLNILNNSCSSADVENLQLLVSLNHQPYIVKQECLRVLKQDINQHTFSICGEVTSQDSELLDDTIPYYYESRVKNTHADDNSMKVVSSVILFCDWIVGIDVSWNIITDRGLSALLVSIRSSKTLQSLNISHNMISDEGLIELCDYLSNSKSTTSIDISFNNLSSGVYNTIVNTLISAEYVTQFNVIGNRLIMSQTDNILFLTSLNKTVSNYVRDALIKVFLNDVSMVNLSLTSSVAIDVWPEDDSALRLTCTALKYNNTVVRCVLDSNDLCDKHLSHICEMLLWNTYITELSLANNLLSDITLLKEILCTKNKTIKILNLSMNRLRKASTAKAIADMILNSDSIEKLVVSGNLWRRKENKIIQSAMATSKGLKHIVL